ncbi:VOC family protein [Halomonas sp. LR3S48]|uniref:VOC family protein n=1 Tax=Halomonas sp. LR3S48 TaxID=2982694 RepID=UPI0021E44A16|nr:VOC family protein [Halomonas sp. LR3S48]UYG04607.1 VOC family protein [Halomonas sp. LR3S48]
MYSHVTFGCSDLEQATDFYDSVFGELGFERRPVSPDGGPASACWVPAGKSLPRFYAYIPFDGKTATPGNGNMVAFSASSREIVDAAYKVALMAGAKDEGAPGERIHYGVGYYGAYFRDLDGNKIHVVYRGDIE